MSKKAARRSAKAEKELEEIIREAQEQPGIADLLALVDQSLELEEITREYQQATVVTQVTSATATY